MSFFWKQAANIKMHRWNYNLPIEETLKAMYYVVNAGRVRYLGASTIQRIVSDTNQIAKEKYDATAEIDRLIVVQVAAESV
jgi:aryl-alcohol dehydrogenase-like predicted oxidoreductase